MAFGNLIPSGLALALIMLANAAHARTPRDPLLRPIEPVAAGEWLTKQAPFQVYGNTYLVGFGG
jgi:hypothetical protein